MDLIPGGKYYLKWVAKNSNTYFVFECEFIKYSDDRFREDFKKYLENLFVTHRNDENIEPFREEIEGLAQPLINNNILNTPSYSYDDEDYINIKKHAFNDPLYPYRLFEKQWRSMNGMHIIGPKMFNVGPYGLFKYIRPVKTVVNGVDITNEFQNTDLFNIGKRIFNYTDDKNSPNWSAFWRYYNEITGSFLSNMLINTRGLIPNKTLFWVDVSNYEIKEANVKQRMIHDKALQGLKTTSLGRDTVSEIAEFVGPIERKEYMDSYNSILPNPRPPARNPSNNFTFKLPPIDRKGGKHKHRKSKHKKSKKSKTRKNKTKRRR